MLAWTIYLSFAGALVQALLPKGKACAGALAGAGSGSGGLALAVQGFVAGMGRTRRTRDDCRSALGAVDGDSLPAGGRWHQPRAGAADGLGRGGGRAVQLEHRAAHE